jgi:hypothetical protein
MNDFEMNPMKTGLMFVPLGHAGDRHFRNASQVRGHLAELEAEIEAVIDPGAEVVTETPQPSILRRLLDYFQRPAPQSQLPSPTSV